MARRKPTRPTTPATKMVLAILKVALRYNEIVPRQNRSASRMLEGWSSAALMEVRYIVDVLLLCDRSCRKSKHAEGVYVASAIPRTIDEMIAEDSDLSNL